MNVRDNKNKTLIVEKKDLCLLEGRANNCRYIICALHGGFLIRSQKE